MSVIWKPKHHSHISVPASRTVIKRPIPDSGLRVFGQQITTYNWCPVLEVSGVQDKTGALYGILVEQLDRVLPTTRLKCTSSDKS